jgi:hypothetical protein
MTIALYRHRMSAIVASKTYGASPGVAATLSALLPGLGQAYNGERDKAASALAISLGVLLVAATLHFVASVSIASEVDSVVPIYALIWLPAVIDAWRIAKGGHTALLGGESKLYVVTMLSCTGPLALPLLWQSPKFGVASKIAWTTVLLLSIGAALWMFIAIGPVVDELLRDFKELELS